MTVERTPRPSRGYLFALTATLVAVLAGPLLHTYGLTAQGNQFSAAL